MEKLSVTSPGSTSASGRADADISSICTLSALAADITNRPVPRSRPSVNAVMQKSTTQIWT